MPQAHPFPARASRVSDDRAASRRPVTTGPAGVSGVRRFSNARRRNTTAISAVIPAMNWAKIWRATQPIACARGLCSRLMIR